MKRNLTGAIGPSHRGDLEESISYNVHRIGGANLLAEAMMSF
jgi:hypothetical protein